MKRSRDLAAILIALAAAVWPGAASAHAFPTSENPPAGAELSKSPRSVRIHFDSPIEPDFSKLAVTDSSGASEIQGTFTVDSTHRYLAAGLKSLSPGDYSVRWSVVAEDGHRTEGTYTFTVINLMGAEQ
jgi:methionine-rich copper-binding protein CopC